MNEIPPKVRFTRYPVVSLGAEFLVPVAEVTAKAIRVLCREIGPVNTARFLNQFTTGLGDYTAQRDEVIGEATVDELVADLRERHKKNKEPRKSGRKHRPRSSRG